MKAAEQLVHPFPPTWDEHSEILILGSFPSVKSREMAYFYGHPQNRFWRVVAALYEDNTPQTVEDRGAPMTIERKPSSSKAISELVTMLMRSSPVLMPRRSMRFLRSPVWNFLLYWT